MVNGLDVGRRLRVIPERLSQPPDCLDERILGYGDSVPHGGHQVSLRRYLSWPLQQALENGQRLGPEANNVAVLEQQGTFAVELEGTERERLIRFGSRLSMRRLLPILHGNFSGAVTA